jgi:outer membrane biosynthesis protein TonB
MSAVRQWKFSPGRKGDTPVKVKATVEVNFKLK